MERKVTAHRVVIYGPGAVGKSSLAAAMQCVGIKPVFVDIEDGTHFLRVKRIEPAPQTYPELLEAIPVAAAAGDAVVLDSLTRAEEMMADDVLKNVPHDGKEVKSTEDYGFRDPRVFIYERALMLFQACDRVIRQGKHVVLIAHDIVERIKNPAGEDWSEYQPRLQGPDPFRKTSRCSVKHRTLEWCDHLFFASYGLGGAIKGKNLTDDERWIWPVRRSSYWAKSRTLSEPIRFYQNEAGSELWKQLFNITKKEGGA
jgi:hypothetical protein